MDALDPCPLSQIHPFGISLERTYVVYRVLIWQQFRTPRVWAVGAGAATRVAGGGIAGIRACDATGSGLAGPLVR